MKNKTILILFVLTLLTIKSFALRMVSVGSGVTEIIYALGVQSNLVGNCVSSNYPKEANDLPKVGYQRMLPSEGIISLNPDIVFITNETGPQSVINQLKNGGVDILKLRAGRSLEDIYLNIEQISNYLNISDVGNVLIEKIKSQKENLDMQISQMQSNPKVLFILGHGGVARVAGKNTAADSMINLSGAENVVADFSGYKPVSPEQFVKLNPEFILTTSMGVDAKGGMEKFNSMPGIRDTIAARNGNILIFDAQYLLGFGPRTVEALTELNDYY